MSKKINLAIAGSGVRFGAYLGAIKALEELGYEIDRIVGTSGGAIAGGLYSSGIGIDAIIDVWNGLDLNKFKKFSFGGMIKNVGLYSNAYVEERIDELTGKMTLKDAKIEFHATVTGEKHGLKVWNKETAPDMTIGKAVRMSSAFPYHYQRIRYQDDAYSDGGWLKNYPIDYFKSGKVLGLQVKGSDAYKKRKLGKTIWGLSLNLFDRDMEHKEHEELEDAVWAKTIQLRTGDIPMMDFNLSAKDRELLLNIGYNTVINNKGKI